MARSAARARQIRASAAVSPPSPARPAAPSAPRLRAGRGTIGTDVAPPPSAAGTVRGVMLLKSGTVAALLPSRSGAVPPSDWSALTKRTPGREPVCRRPPIDRAISWYSISHPREQKRTPWRCALRWHPGITHAGSGAALTGSEPPVARAIAWALVWQAALQYAPPAPPEAPREGRWHRGMRQEGGGGAPASCALRAPPPEPPRKPPPPRGGDDEDAGDGAGAGDRAGAGAGAGAGGEAERPRGGGGAMAPLAPCAVPTRASAAGSSAVSTDCMAATSRWRPPRHRPQRSASRCTAAA